LSGRSAADAPKYASCQDSVDAKADQQQPDRDDKYSVRHESPKNQVERRESAAPNKVASTIIDSLQYSTKTRPSIARTDC
jgi:hypothetical protein